MLWEELMLATENHADRVYALARQTSQAASSPVAASWLRCMKIHKLEPDAKKAPIRLTESDFRGALDQSAAMIEEAGEELDRLFAMTGRSGHCLLLTDSKGVALDRRGSPGDDKDFHGLGLWSGTLWSEASVGTNGIGTALADQRPAVIQREQHFLATNIRLSCTAAPIRDYRGQIAGAIDISTCRDDASDAMMSILTHAVREAALRIESNLFRRAFPTARMIMVGQGYGSLLAVDRDDIVLGATRGARLALGLDDARIAAGLPAADALQEAGGSDMSDDLLEAERAALRRAVSRHGGNMSRTADSLGISRATLHRKFKKLGLN
jgi:transcriptional regulator of acetoin/glycerol metabolism